MRGVCCEGRDGRPGKGELWPEEEQRVWQRRFYDFNVWSERKRVEKLRYMHRNPVKRGLVLEPEQWEWSSFRSYAYQDVGRVRVNLWPDPVLKIQRGIELIGARVVVDPPFAKNAKDGPPRILARSRVRHPPISRFLLCGT